MTEAFAELVRGVHASLRTYSNVHRGSGHNSLVTTRLYEDARKLVLEHLGLGERTHVVVFCTPRRADALAARIGAGRYRTVSSQDLGLPLGVRALAVERKALPTGIPLESGGGTARLVAPGWVVWARPPERFEPGTPAIVAVIAFAKALRLVRRFGRDAFRGAPAAPRAAAEILHHDTLQAYSGQELLGQLRRMVIGRDLVVPTCEGPRSYVNLDNAASTRTFTPVWDAVCETWRQPRSVHEELVREVKAICADLLGAPAADYDVVFTSNTTEAINLVAKGLGKESEPSAAISGPGAAVSEPAPVVVNTLLEHNSNELPWRHLAGASTVRVDADAEGFLDLDELEKVLSGFATNGQGRVQLVAVSGASNVLGSFNDLAAISRAVHRHGARLLVDAAQLVAHREVDMEASGIDALAFSAHKVYAPFGTGVLVVRKGMLRLGPEEMERVRASGEENVGGIAALGKALVLLRRIGLGVIQEQERTLTARALRGMTQIPGLKVYGVKSPESPRFPRKGGVIPFAIKGMMADRVAGLLAEHGIGVRWGCHCAHMLVKRLLHIPRPIEQFQRLIVTAFPRLGLPGVARASLGLENTEADVDRLIEVLGRIGGRSRDKRVEREMDDFAASAARTVYGGP